MDAALVHLALLAYVAASTVFLLWLVRPNPRLPRAGRTLLVGGSAAHICALAAQFAHPWNAPRLLSVVAAAIVTGYLIVDRAGKIPVAGAFIAPLAVVVVIPAHVLHTEAVPAWSSAALGFHIAMATLGTAALGLAFGLSALYLASERQAKARQPGRLFARVGSLESLDHTNAWLAVLGFVFLSLAVATGSWTSSAANGALLPFAPKEIFALLSWALLFVLIQARALAGWRGRRAAMLVVVGFVLLVGAWSGARL